MSTRVTTPQTRCRAAFARADITPPAGIYHRMWGAALHERATGVHRPLTATAMLIESADAASRLLVVGIDHCLLEATEADRMRAAAAAAAGVEPANVHLALSHTHGSAWLSRSRSHLPGGDLIGPYLDRVAAVCGELAAEAVGKLTHATVVYGTARCDLARHRDFWDAASQQIVCGFNPDGPADDTVTLARAVSDSGVTLGTVVNYACHPTTLAWQNTLVSPDYVGAMREVVERETSAPCLFLQGASGDLGPKEGYVGDPAVADRNGRRLGFAALSGLEALPPPGTAFVYAGPVVSGATLGTWEHRPQTGAELDRYEAFAGRRFTTPLPYRADLPTREGTEDALRHWQAEEDAARAAGEEARVRDAHAHVERMTRQLARHAALPEGKSYPLPVGVWRLGGALWVFGAGELYQSFQLELRRRFPHQAVMVATVCDDWQPGYLPATTAYGYGIYQEVIAAVAPGSLEALLEVVTRECRTLLGLHPADAAAPTRSP
ncbi:MAG: neutral/alkaline non-lysosomal ceramidase N-terminal domain-containing protein [Gemmataceae bacterium]